MKVLITGATGFIGAQLAAACVARGMRVRILRRATASMRALAGLSLEMLIGDLCDPAIVLQAVQGCDLVFHAAAISAYWRAKPAEIYQVNVEGTRILLDACLKANVPRFVYTSSAAAIGIAKEGLANEQTPFDPISAGFAYANSKHQAEALVLQAIAAGLAAVIVNPAVVIGAADHYLNSGSIVLAYARGNIPVVPPGGMCIADVDAVVQGHLAAASKGQVGQRYILGGENLSYYEITQLIARAAGVAAPRFVLPAPLIQLVAPLVAGINRLSPGVPLISAEQIRLSRINYFFDSSKAIQALGYPIMPAAAAFEKALSWYRANKYRV